MRNLTRSFRRELPNAKTLSQKVAAILRKYGTDAHVYLPGIGVINGLTAGNYLDSAGTTAATVDNPVGKVDDAAGAIDATQATTANKPILRLSGGKYSWQFDGTDYLSLGSVPFQMADDHCVIAGMKADNYSVGRTIFSVSGTSSGSAALVGYLGFHTNGAVRALWRNDAATLITRDSSATDVGQVVVGTARQVSLAKEVRKNGVSFGTNSTNLGTSTVTVATIGVLQLLSATAYHLGNIYPVIAIKGTVTDADLLTLEKFVGQLSGVTL